MKRLIQCACAFSLFISSASFALEKKPKKALPAAAAPSPAAAATQEEAPFAVQDIPKPEPIEGQLGEPGAPSLKDQQALLAKALLSKGLCNVSYYGEDFCAKQQTKTFKVTDQIGATKSDSELLGEKAE